MRKTICVFFLLVIFTPFLSQVNSAGNGLLKYIIYDFDGLDIGAGNLPDGDYINNDMQIAVAANPLTQSDVIGDRVLKLKLDWQSGGGEFGKATMRFIDLDALADKLNFYIYNPESNSGSASLQVIITEDDNNNDIYEHAADDKWVKNLQIIKSGAWQLISIPLSEFQDDNAGGNGTFDAGYNGNGGMLFSVGFVFTKPGSASVSDTYYLDMICFSEGDLPVGNSILELPYQPSEKGCALGALSSHSQPDQTPAQVHGYLPDGKRISFVNWFLFYSNSGTTPDLFPGAEVQNLLDKGYQPIITWEMMYASYARLDPVQPRLDKILNGSFDAYIDQFAAKIKTYNGSVIMRIFHEFEGDWYSWSLAHNGKDPATYIAAYRHVVDRFRAAGANNVKWMWCLNAEPKPYTRYNSVVKAYPGDSYVDIVATDIYNHPDLGTPDWKSFRYTMAESYYHLVKNYPHKPLYVCEVGCRERYSGEPAGSQEKAQWICMMNKDLKSYFRETEALVFFSLEKEHDWRINSGEEARQAFVSCIWNDAYYGKVVGLEEKEQGFSFSAWPNPFAERFSLLMAGMPDTGQNMLLKIYDLSGKIVFTMESPRLPSEIDPGPALPAGLYLVEIKNGTFIKRQKLIRTITR